MLRILLADNLLETQNSISETYLRNFGILRINTEMWDPVKYDPKNSISKLIFYYLFEKLRNPENKSRISGFREIDFKKIRVSSKY